MHAKLVGREMVAEGTMRFDFEKPEGFDFRAGQNVDLTLIDPPETDDAGNTRTFSLMSAPRDAHLSIATRMRDTAFKRVLSSMELGTSFVLDGPYGDLALHEEANRPVVFLAGGIGITPFHSMLADAALRSLPRRLFLFYSNRRPEDAPFLNELARLAKQHRSITLVPTMTGMVKSVQEWYGEQGRITQAMLAKYGALENRPVFYLAGPSAMVVALRKTLNQAGISNGDIRTEEFIGY